MGTNFLDHPVYIFFLTSVFVQKDPFKLNNNGVLIFSKVVKSAQPEVGIAGQNLQLLVSSNIKKELFFLQSHK